MISHASTKDGDELSRAKIGITGPLIIAAVISAIILAVAVPPMIASSEKEAAAQEAAERKIAAAQATASAQVRCDLLDTGGAHCDIPLKGAWIYVASGTPNGLHACLDPELESGVWQTIEYTTAWNPNPQKFDPAHPPSGVTAYHFVPKYGRVTAIYKLAEKCRDHAGTISTGAPG